MSQQCSGHSRIPLAEPATERIRCSRSSEEDAERELDLTCRPNELGRSKARVCSRTNAIAELPGNCTRKISQAVDVIDIQNVNLIQEVEKFDARFSLDFLVEMKATLDAEVQVNQIITAVGITADEPDTIREWKIVAIGVKTRIDSKPTGAFSRRNNRCLEVSEQGIGFVGHFSEESQGKPVRDIVVADGAVFIDMCEVFGGIGEINGRLNVDG